MLDHLCEELIVEILTRLPPKSLLRFRSVSKSLRSCIDSPAFSRIHASRSPQRVTISHTEKYGGNSFCTIHAQDQLPMCGYNGIKALNFPCRNLNIVGSCNGIICGEGKITLWNPSIMRQLTLRDCPLRCIFGRGIGIGFDPISDDNKIVRIPIHGDGNGESPFVYAMKAGAWRPIASPMPLYSVVSSKSCYLNGVLHWVVERCSTNSDDVELGYIMTLDLSTHVFGMIDLPKPTWQTLQLTTIQGSLAVIYRVSVDWIWVRRDGSWSMIFISETIKAREGVRKVVELTNNGDFLLGTFPKGLQVYNPETGTRSTLVDFNYTSSVSDMYMYVETFQLLHIGTACNVNQPFLQEKRKRENLATDYQNYLF